MKRFLEFAVIAFLLSGCKHIPKSIHIGKKVEQKPAIQTQPMMNVPVASWIAMQDQLVQLQNKIANQQPQKTIAPLSFRGAPLTLQDCISRGGRGFNFGNVQICGIGTPTFASEVWAYCGKVMDMGNRVCQIGKFK
jgi:hypothetical protein